MILFIDTEWADARGSKLVSLAVDDPLLARAGTEIRRIDRSETESEPEAPKTDAARLGTVVFESLVTD